MRIFSVSASQLSGCILFARSDARARFLNNDLSCIDTCSVIGGSITYWGGTNEKDPSKHISSFTSTVALGKEFPSKNVN